MYIYIYYMYINIMETYPITVHFPTRFSHRGDEPGAELGAEHFAPRSAGGRRATRGGPVAVGTLAQKNGDSMVIDKSFLTRDD